MSDGQKGRLHYIDVLEMISIFAVCMCHHCSTIGQTAGATLVIQFITVFAVPVFFMCNGTLLMQGRFDVRKHYKKTAMFFVYTTVWKLLYLVFMYLTINRHDTLPTVQELITYFLGGNITIPFIPADHFWYMYAIIGIYLVFPLFYELYHNGPRGLYLFFIGLTFVLYFLVPECTVWLNTLAARGIIPQLSITELVGSMAPFSSRTGNFLFFFLLGPVLHDTLYQKQSEYTWKHGVIFAVSSVAGYLLMVANRMVEYGTLEGEWVLLASYYQRLGLVLMCAGAYAFWAIIPLHVNGFVRFCQFISVRTMGLYAIHKGVAYILSLINTRYIHYANIPYHLAKTVVVILISLGITQLLSLIPGVRTVLGLNWHKPVRQKI